MMTVRPPGRRPSLWEANVKKISSGVALAIAAAALAACSHAPATTIARSTTPAGSPAVQTVPAAAVTQTDLAPIDSQMQQLDGDLKSADDGMNSTQEGDVSR